MTPVERADFLAWLSRLSLDQLREVSSHVNGVITHKRSAKLRALSPGANIVFLMWNDKVNIQAAGTVIRLFKTSVEVENEQGLRRRVEVENILGLHVGGMEYTPLESTQPLGFPQVPAVQQQVPGEGESGRFSLADEEQFNPPIDWTPPTE